MTRRQGGGHIPANAGETAENAAACRQSHDAAEEVRMTAEGGTLTEWRSRERDDITHTAAPHSGGTGE